MLPYLDREHHSPPVVHDGPRRPARDLTSLPLPSIRSACSGKVLGGLAVELMVQKRSKGQKASDKRDRHCNLDNERHLANVRFLK